jgi:hypothetical protein
MGSAIVEFTPFCKGETEKKVYLHLCSDKLQLTPLRGPQKKDRKPQHGNLGTPYPCASNITQIMVLPAPFEADLV